MLSLIEQASAKCPDTELVISGYRYISFFIYLQKHTANKRSPFPSAKAPSSSTTQQRNYPRPSPPKSQQVSLPLLALLPFLFLPATLQMPHQTNLLSFLLPSHSRPLRRPRSPAARGRHPELRSRLHLPRRRHYLHGRGRLYDALDLWHGCG
jgi:hypothetical protein